MWKSICRFLSLALLVVSTAHGVRLQAAPLAAPSALWDQGPTPFIALYVCRNQLETHFPNIAADLENELVMAAEEWFTGSGADIRLYYFGSLNATDPACANVPTLIRPRLVDSPPAGPTPPRWSVVLTAAPELRSQIALPGQQRCHFAVTDRWVLPASPGTLFFSSASIERVRITLARGESCSGPNSVWPWPGMAPAGQPGLSPARVLMKMLGHALGLSEETGSADTIMAPIDPNVNRWLSHVTEPVVQIMRASYGPLRSRPYRVTMPATGSNWSLNTSPPRPGAGGSLGHAACETQFSARPAPVHIVTETSFEADGTSSVKTRLFDQNGQPLEPSQSHGPSNRAPTILCRAGQVVLGFVTPDGTVRIRGTTDGLTWSDSQLAGTSLSTYAPALADVPWANAILVGTSDEQQGSRWLLSTDNGATFALASSSMNSSQSTRFPYGVACVTAQQKCYVASGDYGFSLQVRAIQGTSLIWVSTSGGGQIPNLGVTMMPTSNNQGFHFGRRYKPGSRFYSTPGASLAEVQIGTQANAGTVAWQFSTAAFTRFVSDVPISLMRNPSTSTVVVLGAAERRYNGYLYTVVRRRRTVP